MICNNIDGIGQTFQVVLPNLESFKDSKKFLVMHVVVQLHCSKSIQFSTKITREEPDDKIELGEVLKPLCLPLGQYLDSRKILKVFMICNNINRNSQTL